MIESDFRLVCRRIGMGAKFRLGRNPAGRLKLKLRCGPFGVFVKRFDINDDDLKKLRTALSLNGDMPKGSRLSSHAVRA